VAKVPTSVCDRPPRAQRIEQRAIVKMLQAGAPAYPDETGEAFGQYIAPAKGKGAVPCAVLAAAKVVHEWLHSETDRRSKAITVCEDTYMRCTRNLVYVSAQDEIVGCRV